MSNLKFFGTFRHPAGAGSLAVMGLLFGTCPILAQPLPPATVETTLGTPAAPAIVPFSGPAITRFIKVTGSGTVRVSPGEAHIFFLVSSTDADPVKALDDNTKQVAKVVAELHKRGVPTANIVASESSLASLGNAAPADTGAGDDTGTPIDVAGGSPPANPRQYTANARVQVVTYEITHATQIVQIGMYGGATSVLGMRFEPSNLPDAKAQALIAALHDAINKAQILAAGVNTKILYAISVSEIPTTAAEPVGGAVAPPAEVPVPVTIEVVYAIG